MVGAINREMINLSVCIPSGWAGASQGTHTGTHSDVESFRLWQNIASEASG